MNKLIFGDGIISVQAGKIEGEGQCITLTEVEVRPVGSIQAEWKKKINRMNMI